MFRSIFPSGWRPSPLAASLLVVLASCADLVQPIEVSTVTIDAIPSSLVPGRSAQLTARPAGPRGESLTGQATTWSSDNTAVATVDPAGLLTAMAPGNALITATIDEVTGGAVITVGHPRPSLSAITPATVGMGQAGTVTLTGTNFFPSSIVRLNGFSMSTSYVSDTELRVRLTSSDVQIGGQVSIDVFNPVPGGGASTSLVLNVVSPCDLSVPIVLGETRTGTLASGDCLRPGNRFSDRYSFTLGATTTVSISQSSTAFDSYLLLLSATGATIAVNDDYAYLDSRIFQSLGPGTYTVIATSFSGGEAGPYTLSLAESSVVTVVPPPVVPELLSPPANAVISQDGASTACGGGPRTLIRFDWSDAGHPSGIREYDIEVHRQGAALLAVGGRVTASEHIWDSCGYIADHNLDRWEWRVRARASNGEVGAWTDYRPFSFAPCRRPGGGVCTN